MYNSNEILQLINDYLENIRFDRKPQSLYEPIKYVLDIGGKRIRPTLMMLAYNLSRMTRRASCRLHALLRHITITHCCTTTSWTMLTSDADI